MARSIAPLALRDPLRSSIIDRLTNERGSLVDQQVSRALLIYARANEQVAFAKSTNHSDMLRDGRHARAVALAMLEELNEATPLSFMPKPRKADRTDIADGFTEMVLDCMGFLDAADAWLQPYDVPLANNAVSPYEAYADTLVDILASRRGLFWTPQQKAA